MLHYFDRRGVAFLFDGKGLLKITTLAEWSYYYNFDSQTAPPLDEQALSQGHRAAKQSGLIPQNTLMLLPNMIADIERALPEALRPQAHRWPSIEDSGLDVITYLERWASVPDPSQRRRFTKPELQQIKANIHSARELSPRLTSLRFGGRSIWMALEECAY